MKNNYSTNNIRLMINYLNVQTIQSCLDDYMTRKGKVVINEIEANRELERAGIMNDDVVYPGEPLREFLRKLRDSNLLPRNISQLQSMWAIRHSKAVAKLHQIFKNYV